MPDIIISNWLRFFLLYFFLQRLNFDFEVPSILSLTKRDERRRREKIGRGGDGLVKMGGRGTERGAAAARLSLNISENHLFPREDWT